MVLGGTVQSGKGPRLSLRPQGVGQAVLRTGTTRCPSYWTRGLTQELSGVESGLRMYFRFPSSNNSFMSRTLVLEKFFIHLLFYLKSKSVTVTIHKMYLIK